VGRSTIALVSLSIPQQNTPSKTLTMHATFPEKIQLVDLVGQHARIREELDEAVRGVMDTGAFIKGPDVDAFAAELAAYTGVRHVIPCGNGTDALQIALMAAGVGPGDEVITTGFTFIATVEVVALLGARPVLVDVQPDTFNIDVAAVERAMTPQTKAIVPVHLFGQPADMDALMALAEARNVTVVEDNAQAIGARWNGAKVSGQTGTLGHLGTTSFFPSKNLGCLGDGGAVFTNDDHLASLARSIANHGMEKRYYHERVGINSRLDTLQAAMLRVKLRHLDSYIASRQAAADRYDALLGGTPGVTVPFRDPRATHVFHQYTVLLADTDRDRVVELLAAEGIPTGVYYPVPGHAQEAFAGFGYEAHHYPVSSDLARKVLSLPMHTELTETQQQHIAARLIAACKAAKINEFA
jgi:UDP-2-acetamido-2-deoxy-ribo-hexuluronate aminotransferase